MIKVVGVPKQSFAFGVTIIVDITGVIPVFIVVKLGILPLPVAAKPIEGVSFVQSKIVPYTFPVKRNKAARAANYILPGFLSYLTLVAD